MLLKLKDTQGNDYLLNKYTIGVVKNHSPGVINISYMLGNKIEYLTTNMTMDEFRTLSDDNFTSLEEIREMEKAAVVPVQFNESEITAYIADHAPLKPEAVTPSEPDVWLSGTEFATLMGIDKTNLKRWRENGKVNWKKDELTGYYLYKQIGDTECL